MSTIRWGILSTANIGRKAVTPAIQASQNGTVSAVASRTEADARSYADDLGIDRAYGSYDALLNDSDIDAIYNPLPNSLHKEWTIRALEAGKHVLCEKPFAVTAQDCLDMQAVADKAGVKLMEAFMYRFHPRSEAALQQVSGGAVGELRFIRSAFTFQIQDRDNIRLDADLGGGALMDVGCYCVNASRTLTGLEPVEAQAFARFGPSDVDEELYGTLRFENGVVAQFVCGLTLPRREHVTVGGDKGYLEIPRAFTAPKNEEVGLEHHPVGEPTTTQSFDAVDQYRLMTEHFGDAVLGNTTLRYDGHEAARNMSVIEALYRSARGGGKPQPVVAA
ncbi:MAG: Gfo/Idh/MocA family oxidoreductase [Trueperaceae bacterium]|nr:Gfo/Idh/MocA family oxidoreductase [Trueperaceae bacterium]